MRWQPGIAYCMTRLMSGDHTRGHLLGRPGAADRQPSRQAPPGAHCSVRAVQREPSCHRSRRGDHIEHGACSDARQRLPAGKCHGTTPRFGRQRDCPDHLEQNRPHRPSRRCAAQPDGQRRRGAPASAGSLAVPMTRSASASHGHRLRGSCVQGGLLGRRRRNCVEGCHPRRSTALSPISARCGALNYDTTASTGSSAGASRSRASASSMWATISRSVSSGSPERTAVASVRCSSSRKSDLA